MPVAAIRAIAVSMPSSRSALESFVGATAEIVEPTAEIVEPTAEFVIATAALGRIVNAKALAEPHPPRQGRHGTCPIR